MSLRWSLTLIGVGFIGLIALLWSAPRAQPEPEQATDLPIVRPQIIMPKNKTVMQKRTNVAQAVLAEKLTLRQAAMILLFEEKSADKLPSMQDAQQAEAPLREYARIVLDQVKLIAASDATRTKLVQRLIADLQKDDPLALHTSHYVTN